MDRISAAICVGEIAEAERLLRSRLFQNPRDIGAVTKLAELAVDNGKIVEGIALLGTAIAIEPSAHILRLQLARLHQRQGQFPAALKHIELLPEPLRHTSEIKAEEASLLGQLGQRENEIAIYEELLRHRPRDFRLLMSLANSLNYSGRAFEAVRCLRRAIKIRPTSGEPWWSLSNLKSFRFENGDIAAMQRTLRRNKAPAEAVHLHFALGSAFEAIGKHQQSFDHYVVGNSIRAASLGPEQMRVTAFVDAAIAVFNGSLFKRHDGVGCEVKDPIFIIGLQRSGSTLLEQILSSHPQIEGASELLAMQQLWSNLARVAHANGRNAFQQIDQIEPGTIRRIGEEYMESTRPFRLLGRPYFIDKLPANWLNVGLIRLALPNAKIIDARRNPMACGFSNFKQLYAHGVTYAYSLPSIGRFYRDYMRLMQHFDQVQPGAIHHVLHESLVERPETEIRRMLDYLGLPFDQACLEFHKNARAVHTPSAGQVRRPINRDGVDAWRAYEQWLDPLKDALGPTLKAWNIQS